MANLKNYGPTILRVVAGFLFLFPGLSKLMNPAGITGMLSGIGFPLALLFTWLLIASEIFGGLALIIGFKTKYAVWPLIIIMAVAALLVILPKTTLTNASSLMFHILAIASLFSIYLTGPGKLALDKG